jgi:hypothetical protein
MTTIADIKRWTRPIRAEHDDLVLEKRDLYLLPLRHIYRAIEFLGSSQRTFPTPAANFGVLFAPPSAQMSHSNGLYLQVGYSTDPLFQELLESETRKALEGGLRRLHSIEAFYELTLEDNLIWRVLCTGLPWSPMLQATVLAALGKFPEARQVTMAYIEQADEAGLRAVLASGQALQAKRPRSSDAYYDIKYATAFLQRLSDIRLLDERVRDGDHSGLAALLHQWEQDRVRHLGVEHLWEPTPFPLERGL